MTYAKRRWLALAVVWAMAGCRDGASDEDEDGASAPGGTEDEAGSEAWGNDRLADCGLDAQTQEEVESLYEACDSSVHELITCGGIQARLGRSLMVALVASNADIMTPEAEAQLATMVPTSTFRQDGTHEMMVGDDGRSIFSIRFYEPGDEEAIIRNVFDLESYLAGPEVDASMTFDEMWEDPDRPCRFAFRFAGPGPLAHLLNGGEPLRGPFVVDLSLSQIYELLSSDGSPSFDLGPFASLLGALEVQSDLVFVDDLGSASIEYSAQASRMALGELLEEGMLSFQIPAIEAWRGSITMEAASSEVQFLVVGRLAGVMEYQVDGVGMELAVQSDFGTGSGYPIDRWRCP
ncbi:MAG: hypothetical protein HYY06_31240 [Deltaproteobacteria bacterium]|nr:hypothetical protein [Deltaproteobacteria bacterium]